MTTHESAKDVRSITLHRLGEHHYRATAPSGASIELGRDDDLMSPVEVLLAALAACASIDVDSVTSRRSEPEHFEVTASAERGVDETGGVRLSDLLLGFDLQFPDTDEGRQAAALVERCVQISHDKECTVSRTIEAGTPVRMEVR